MRITLFAALLLIASPALGDTLNLNKATLYHQLVGHNATSTMDMFIRLGSDGPKWTVPVDVRTYGRTMYLTEANAASYGFDWIAAEDFVADIGWKNFTVQVGTVINGVETYTPRTFGGPLYNGTPELVGFELTTQTWNPQWLRVWGRMTYLAPEPSSAVLFTFGLMGLCLHRRPVKRDSM